MAYYTYRENNSAPTERFNRVKILLDNGKSLTLVSGGTYDLTTNEYIRASQEIVLIPGSAPPTPATRSFSMDILGNLDDGDIPIWSSKFGSFVAGSLEGSNPLETISVAGGLRGEVVPGPEPAVWGVASRTLTTATRTWLLRFCPTRAWNITLGAWDVTTAATADDPVELAIYTGDLTSRVATSGVQTGKLNATGIKTVSITASLDPAQIYYLAFKGPVSVGGTGATVNGRTLNSTTLSTIFGTTAPTALAGFIDLSSPLPTSITAGSVSWTAVNTYPLIALREI